LVLPVIIFVVGGTALIILGIVFGIRVFRRRRMRMVEQSNPQKEHDVVQLDDLNAEEN